MESRRLELVEGFKVGESQCGDFVDCVQRSKAFSVCLEACASLAHFFNSFQDYISHSIVLFNILVHFFGAAIAPIS